MSKLDAILAEVGREVGYVQKGGRNTAQKYTYARAEDVLRKVNEALFSRGVSISSRSDLTHYNVTPYEKDTGQYGIKQMFRTDAAVHIALTFHFDGETRTVEAVGAATDTGDKAVYKANTGAIKYLLAGAFLISWGDDPEADESVDEEARGYTKPVEAPKPKQAPSAQKATASESKGLVDSFSKRMGECSSLAELEQVGVQLAAAPLTESDKEMLRSIYSMTKERVG